MARLGDRIARLEAWVRAAGLTREDRFQAEVEEVLSGLETDDLNVLGKVLDKALEGFDENTLREAEGSAGAGSDFASGLRAGPNERNRDVLDACLEVVKAVRRGEISF
jgi:hypothetical protein